MLFLCEEIESSLALSALTAFIEQRDQDRFIFKNTYDWEACALHEQRGTKDRDRQGVEER